MNLYSKTGMIDTKNVYCELKHDDSNDSWYLFYQGDR